MRKPKACSPEAGKRIDRRRVQKRRAHAFWEMEAPLQDCFQRAEIATI
jgi:hypothetical protein